MPQAARSPPGSSTAPPGRSPLDDAFELRALDTGDTWTVGTLAPPGPPALLVAPGPAAAAAPPGPVTTPGAVVVAPTPVLAATAAVPGDLVPFRAL